MNGTHAASTAVGVVELVRDERFAEVVSRFAAPLRAIVSVETLRGAWATELGKHGVVTAIGDPTTEPGGPGLVHVSVPVTCEHGGLTVVLSVDDGGMLAGMRIVPANTVSWAPPPYAMPNAMPNAMAGGFTEHEVTVGTDALAVGGTLTIPDGDGPHPGVVLLSGGGPFDRDETSGSNKPLKDLAWGLACHGIAVARFDKVTHTHPEVVTAPDFTMTAEYVPHAVSAIHLLAEHVAVNPDRVFVLGHSMGGKVAPRVAAAEPSVAGLVLLAADAQPMHLAGVRVARYLAAVNPGPGADAFVESIERQAARIDSPDLSASTPAAELPLGLPGSYWLDLRDYDPVASAAALSTPMLILQGGRDYQVTVADDLARWKAGLAHRADVTIRVHEPDNHLFFPGNGPSTPAEYEAPQHVDPTVITDIARWLTAV